MRKNSNTLFSFLKYVQPTHYFQLLRNDGSSIFPVVTELSDGKNLNLKPDHNYKSKIAIDYDLSWQAIQNGYIGDSPTYTKFTTLNLLDEYLFIKKYFHPVWSIYVLIIRILILKNPRKEINAWRNSRKVSTTYKVEIPFKYDSWTTFNSPLLEKQPIISVIIPTLNRYGHLKNVLRDFEQQDYKNFEVIIVDQSEPFQKQFFDQFELNIIVVRQQEKALWLARNTAVAKAKGEIIALSEDDVRIAPDWITNHIKCLDFFRADISAGVFYPEGSNIPVERSFFSIASQFATGNAMLYKSVFRKIGSFDRQFERQRMGDGEFGLRAFIHGYRSVSNPYASCLDVKAETGGFRQLGSWDAFRPKSIFSPRPLPSVLYLYRKYFGTESSILALLKSVPPSIIPYRYKKNKKLLFVGGLISLILFPLVVFQVTKSWWLSGKKLQEGALINEIT